MQITRKDTDKLNATLTITIEKNDFSETVENKLKEYRKNANVPGFRKGFVPMGMIKKQYENPLISDEVNKLIQENINKYITEEKLAILGSPLMNEPTEEIDWKNDSFVFTFDLGISPEFDVDLKTKKAVTTYQIDFDDAFVNKQMKNIQKQYGKLESKETVEDNSELNIAFILEGEEQSDVVVLEMEEVKGKKAKETLKNAKKEETLTLATKGLFKEEETLRNLTHRFPLTEEPKEITFVVKEINTRTPAEIDKELFDKIDPSGNINSEEELKNKIKEETGKQFTPQVERRMMNDVTEKLIENTKFDLPKDFLIRWIKTSGENPLSEEEAIVEYTKSEKGIRYQLIEGKIVADNNLTLQFEELKEFAKETVEMQLAQFGGGQQLNMDEKQIESFTSRILSDEEQVKQLSEQLMGKKILGLFKEKANLKEKKVTYDEYIKTLQ